MKLRVRLAVVMTILGMAVIPLTCGLAWYLSAQQIRDTIDSDLIERVTLLDRISRTDLGVAARIPVGDRTPPIELVLGSQDSGVQFFDGLLRPFGPNQVPMSEATTVGLSDGGGPLLETTSHDGKTYRVLTSEIIANVASAELTGGPIVVQFYRDVTAEEAAIASLALQLTLLASFGVVAVAVAGWFIGRWVANPVDRLTDVAERLARFEDPPARIEMSRTDEVGRLAVSFNRMLSALEVGREQQQRLVADASHELRTPLTSLRIRAEFLAGRPAVDQAQADLLAGAVVEIEQLSALVNDLVDLAADVRSADEAPRALPLVDVANEVADRTSIATGRPIEVDVDRRATMSDTTAVVRPSMIRRALQNLVDNAVKYGGDNGRIVITVGSGRLEVSDEGPGIGPDDIDHIFDRFYRSPKARTRPGNGIGLAIVSQVAEAHGGQTWATNGPGGVGATVGFSVAAQSI